MITALLQARPGPSAASSEVRAPSRNREPPREAMASGIAPEPQLPNSGM